MHEYSLKIVDGISVRPVELSVSAPAPVRSSLLPHW